MDLQETEGFTANGEGEKGKVSRARASSLTKNTLLFPPPKKKQHKNPQNP